jgi:Dolichyl-phosphate-mannose-protein mannosyltransferase
MMQFSAGEKAGRLHSESGSMTKHVLILAVLIGVALGLATPRVSTGLFMYDEADYMFAAQFGPAAHWLDLEAMPLVEYVRIGLGRGRDPQQRLAISEIGRAGNDPNVYRHWHGPVYWYWLGFVRNFTEDEHTLRWLSLLFPVITAITLYFGTLRILPEDSGPLAALLSTALFLWSPATLETTELAPHLAFVFFSTTALLFLSKVMMDGTRRDWYAAVVATGLAFCTLEVTFVLVAVLAISAWRQRKALAADLRFCGTSLALFIATILVIWPAGLLKLTFVKAYLFLAYLSLFRKAPWGGAGFAGGWALRFALSPIEWILIAAGLALFFWRWREPAARATEPFVWFALLMVLSLLRVNGEGPRYSVPFLFALDVVAGWMIASALPFRDSRARYATVFGIVVLLGAVSAWKLSEYHPDDSLRLRSILASIRGQGGERTSILVPQEDLPPLHYYLPHAQVHGYLAAAGTQSLHAVVDGTLPSLVVYPGDPPRVQRLETPK